MPEKEVYECTGCGYEYPGKSNECSKCQVPVFDCCGLIAIISKRINPEETPEYQELEQKFNKLIERKEIGQLQPTEAREYESTRARLKNMRKTPSKRTIKRYCPKCAKPITKLLK